MSGISDARALAEQLARLSVPALAQLLRARGVSASASWQDCFDAAEGLLDAASVDGALTALPRAAVRALQDAARAGAPAAHTEADRLRRLGLIGEGGMPFAVVADRLNAALEAHPDAVIDDTAYDPPVPAAHEAVVAERAAASTRALTDLVALCAERPLPATGAGAVTAVERRHLIDAHFVEDGQQLDDLLALATAAGVLEIRERAWRTASGAHAWLSLPLAERWGVIAQAWRAGLPPSVHTADGGHLPPSAWDHAQPLDVDWPARVRGLRRIASRWGLYGADGAEPGWTRPLRTGGDAGTAALAAHLPAEITTVYLQADLTAIAPGPLRADLDMRLRTMTVRESQAQASVHRFTADSVAAAIAGGEDAASLRAFLGALSLTGIPQPLDYLIEQTAARHGLVRVGSDGDGTRVTSTDTGLLRTIAVDHAVRTLGLTADADAAQALVSRLPRDAVYWTLADAKYPVVAIDVDGRTAAPIRHRARTASIPADDDDGLRALAGRLLAHSSDDAAWLLRELEQAVRGHVEIAVVVRLPDGTEREFTLEATGLGGGRLRGRDRAADIERTLPVSHIVSVRPR